MVIRVKYWWQSQTYKRHQLTLSNNLVPSLTNNSLVTTVWLSSNKCQILLKGSTMRWLKLKGTLIVELESILAVLPNRVARLQKWHPALSKLERSQRWFLLEPPRVMEIYVISISRCWWLSLIWRRSSVESVKSKALSLDRLERQKTRPI